MKQPKIGSDEELDFILFQSIVNVKDFFKWGNQMNDYFTVNELAKEFRVNPKTIYGADK